MKTLILFDGSKTGYLCLKSACQDACAVNAAQAGKAGQAEPIEAMLVTPESLYFDQIVTNQTLIYMNHGQFLLDEGIKELERCGEFDLISGRIVQSNPANLTQVLIDQAKVWQATTIYIAIDEERTTSQPLTLKKQSAWLSWLGIKRRPADCQAEIQMIPETPLNTTQVKVKQLLEQSQCRVVMINSQGIAMRVSYYPPATSPELQERAEQKAETSKFGRVA